MTIEEYESFSQEYKLDTKRELSNMLTTFSYNNGEQLAMRIVSFYNHKVSIGRKYYTEIGMVAFLTINNNAFQEFIESIENTELRECIIDMYDTNIVKRLTVDTEICLMPIRIRPKEGVTKKHNPQNEQQASRADQLKHYKPTKEQKEQALRNMQNAAEKVEYSKQIKMPTLEINRSKYKFVNLFWDTLDSVLPK